MGRTFIIKCDGVCKQVMEVENARGDPPHNWLLVSLQFQGNDAVNELLFCSYDCMAAYAKNESERSF